MSAIVKSPVKEATSRESAHAKAKRSAVGGVQTAKKTGLRLRRGRGQCRGGAGRAGGEREIAHLDVVAREMHAQLRDEARDRRILALARMRRVGLRPLSWVCWPDASTRGVKR